MEPREVVVGRASVRPPRSPPPPLLHACAESRFYLGEYYTKAFTFGTPARYSWVNFEMDTIYLSQGDLLAFEPEISSIRWLIVESEDAEHFFYKDCSPLIHCSKVLKTVTILDVKSGGAYQEWWREWDDLMEMFYFGDDAVPFYTKITNANDPASIEINPDNYLKIERDGRRKFAAEHPESWSSDEEISDDDDDRMSAPGRFRTGWRHVQDCNCAYKRGR